MSDLVSELKHEHSQITGTLRKVLELGINSEEGRDLLYSAKSYLLAHLKKEDVELYPSLREAAKENSDLRNTLDLYSRDMDAISKVALEFFDMYASGGDPQEFDKDYKKLFRLLYERILKEESVIYKKYDEILSQ